MTIYSATDGPMVRGNQLRGDELFGGSTVSQTCHSCVLHELDNTPGTSVRATMPVCYSQIGFDIVE